MKLLLCLLAAVASPLAIAGNTDDLCTLATIEQHGFRCKVVHYSDGSQADLLVKNYVRPTDSGQRKARARLLINQVVERHFVERGGIVKIRFIGKDGAWYERPCNRGKNTLQPYCYDAERVKE